MFFPPVAWLEHLAPVEDRLLRAIFIQHSVLHRKKLLQKDFKSQSTNIPFISSKAKEP